CASRPGASRTPSRDCGSSPSPAGRDRRPARWPTTPVPTRKVTAMTEQAETVTSGARG
ncbi:MAG: hypothetical protein AVDCRST_MAG41-586, partial [uncultured Corynebacteriales bacterium]